MCLHNVLREVDSEILVGPSRYRTRSFVDSLDGVFDCAGRIAAREADMSDLVSAVPYLFLPSRFHHTVFDALSPTGGFIIPMKS